MVLIRDSDNVGFHDTITHVTQDVAVSHKIPLAIPKGYYLAISQIIFGNEFHGTQGEYNEEVVTIDCIMTKDLGGTKGISAPGMLARKEMQTWFKVIDRTGLVAAGFDTLDDHGETNVLREKEMIVQAGVWGESTKVWTFHPPVFLHHTQKALWRYAKVTTEGTIASFTSMQMTVWIRGFLTKKEDITRIYGIR